ncbi:MAG: LLM class flavin-dependent oxidoreductase [Acidimicrobiales bacterium]|nr:LLM class flavin-dependent oxidoreductase [Acidimicrobiales bacterium]MDG2219427.1 LLM class flavin-dependent oxidoreductase [Acidimicrobiales bacterium]
MTFEAEITPGMSPADAVELGCLVEDAGFDRLGISCVALWPDTYQLQALIAANTERIHIGSMVTNPYTRHAAVHASALATLQEISGGRAFCGMGVGAGLEEFGIDYPTPVKTLRETVSAIRILLSGDAANLDGDTVTLNTASLRRPPTTPVPIAIGTRSPGVMKLAGEVADIALVGARHLTPEIVARYRAWIAEGAARVDRDVDAIEVLPRVTLCVSEDENLAVTSVKRFAAHYLDILGDHGPPVDPIRRSAIAAALAEATGWYFDLDRFDPPEMLRLIDADLARQFAVVGTPEQCAAQLRALMQLGFNGVSCNLAAVARDSMFDGLRETIEGAGEVLRLLGR